MSDVFSQTFHVRWSDLDPNIHMRHTSYLDLCAATRFSYLKGLGFDMKKFAEIKIGPVIFSENVSYLNEVLPGDQVRVNVRISGLSPDGRKWKMFHEMFRESDGKLSATLEVSGAWFHIEERKLKRPPESLQEKIASLPKTEDFQEL